MDLSTFDQSKYLGKKDIPDDGIVLHIASFDIVDLKDGESKLAVFWREPGVKPLLLNKTNRNRLRQLFKADETRNMIGKPVGVWNDPGVEYGGQVVGGLRIRAAPAPAAPAPAYQPGHQPNPTRTQPAAPVAGFDDEVPF